MSLDRIVLILTLRCEAATELSSRAIDEPLGLAERIALRGHLLACRSCQRFHRQIREIGAALRREDDAPGLSDSARERIAVTLRAAAAEEEGSAPAGGG